jgi:hypothetical protein
MFISLEERKENPKKELLFNKLARVSYKLKDRVLNPKFKQYKNYGGRGVTMDEKWLTSKGFIEDVDSIDGWDEEKFLAGELELDKDIKFKGNKVYDKEHTMWVTHKENMQYLPEVQKPFYAYNEYTQEIKEGFNQTLFAMENNLNKAVVSSVIQGRKHRAGDWWMWIKGTNPPTPIRYHYVNEKGEDIWDVNPRRLSLKLGYNRAYITNRINHPDNLRIGHKIWVEEINLTELINKYKMPND